MILTFLVTFYAIYNHQLHRGEALRSISAENFHRSNSGATDRSVEAIDKEPNEPEDEESSEDKNIDKNEAVSAPIRDSSDDTRREKEIDSSLSNLHAVLEDEELQAKGKLSDKTNWTPSDYGLKKMYQEIMPFIEILNLENKTQEEIKKEIYVDFSTLDTSEMPNNERLHAKVLLNCYADAFQVKKARSYAEKLHPSDHSKYDLRKFNGGIVAVGVENFMKAATQFCEEEAAAGEIPIVSIGSGDGTVEEEIIAQYRNRFGKEIRIQLVDPDPKFDGIVDFKTVDHLVTENPRIVGNCVAFIIWPNPDDEQIEEKAKDDYDIETIRKLQPKAVLAIYECTGMSGSHDFRNFLHEDSLDDIAAQEFGVKNWLSKFQLAKKRSYGLDNYAVLEVARQKIILPRSGTLTVRLVKITKTI